MEEKRRKVAVTISLVAFVALLGAAAWLVGRPLVSFVSDSQRVRTWVDSNYWLSRIGYALMVAVQVVVAFIPGEPFEIAAGYAFGTWGGTIICLCGMAAGSILVFLLVRSIGSGLLRVFFSQEKIDSMRFLRTGRNGWLLVFLVFALPGTPKDIIGYYAGLTDMKFPAWLFTCTVGRIPSLVTSTIGGDALGTGKYWFAAIVFVSTLLISGAGLLVYRRLSSRKVEGEEVKDVGAADKQ